MPPDTLPLVCQNKPCFFSFVMVYIERMFLVILNKTLVHAFQKGFHPKVV